MRGVHFPASVACMWVWAVIVGSTMSFASASNNVLTWSKFNSDKVKCVSSAINDPPRFCNMVTYDILAEGANINLSIQALDLAAERAFETFLQALDRADCSKPYGAHTCADCIHAYKHWLCALHFIRCDSEQLRGLSDTCDFETSGGCDFLGENVTDSSGVKRPCLSMCHAVAKTCPATLRFDCPSVENPGSYSSSSSTCYSL